MGFVAAGSGINRPPTFGLISMNTSADEQGATLGVAQSAGSLARIIAPVAANLLYQRQAALPYYVCAAISLLAGLIAWVWLCRGQRRVGVPD
jgi:MFS transporter, DHA1 family, tetracycline resistance protein